MSVPARMSIGDAVTIRKCNQGGVSAFRLAASEKNENTSGRGCGSQSSDLNSRMRMALSDLARIVRPMKQSLSLPATAIEITAVTMLLQLGDVSSDCPPSRNLT
jgi:hypothetical protein